MIGKWHLGQKPPYLPLSYGFDEYFGLPYSHDYWPVDYDGKPADTSTQRGKWPVLHFIEGNTQGRAITNLDDASTITTLYTQKAVSFINRNKNRPFFLYLAHNMPHVPLAVSSKYKNKSGAGLYGDVMEEIDWSVSEIMKALKANGLAKNTIVIFTSDNGPHKENGGDPDFFNSSGGFKGIKRDLYEGGIREPFIAYQKGLTKAGTVNEMPCALWDLFPTFLQLCDVPQTNNVDGISIVPALKGQKQNSHKYFYWEIHEGGGRQAVRFGNWKGVRLDVSTKINSPIELYDLKTDPQEKNNVASKHPEIVKQIDAFMKEAYVPNPDWPLMVSEIKK